MYKKLIIIAVLSAMYLGCLNNQPNNFDTQVKQIGDSSILKTDAPITFTNHNFESYQEKFGPPDWWGNRRKFQLRQNYPDSPPAVCPPDVCRWKNFDAATQPIDYMRAVLDYAYEGNVENDWIAEKNTARNWYHAPWMHALNHGREFINGMTKERTTCLNELVNGKECEGNCGSGNNQCFQNWAISLYNEPGAYYINRVWSEVKKTDRNLNILAEGFPKDTVTIKLLFTEADETKVEYLKDGIEWQADTKRIKNKPEADCPELRCVNKLRLLQIDLAVRDNRYDSTGWVFGSYIYNFKPAEPDKWQRMELIGLMFGNGLNPSQSRLNQELDIPQHYGCGQIINGIDTRRMNGPVDNPKSSCLSCHSFAETPSDLSIGRLTETYNKMNCNDDNWFRNINPRSSNTNLRTFTAGTTTLDYSLQLREGIMRYCLENTNMCGKQNDSFGNILGITKDGIQIEN